jgi:hypothetical protein
VGIELNGKNPIFHNLIQSPTSCTDLEMLSEPKLAMGIYFHCWFRLSQPAGVVGIELNDEKPIFHYLIQFPTHLAHPKCCQSRNRLWGFISTKGFGLHHL